MASGIAHDFNNALCSVLGFSELLLAEPGILDDREKALSYLELVRAGAADAASVVRRLREFYRPAGDGNERQRLNLPRIVETAISLTRPRWCNQALASGRIVKVHSELVAVADVWGEEAAVRESMTNLILNAADAIPGDGTISVRVRRDGGWALLEVADDGRGMSEEVRRRCLEPFFSTKGEEGSGLGMSMVYGVVQRHGGQLDVASTPGRGTTVTVRLPIGPPQRAAATGAPALPTATGKRVLVVDDEAMVGKVVSKSLALDGHRPQAVASGAEALELLGGQPFDLLIADRAMPGMTGDELVAKVASRHPEVGIVLLSGFGDLMLAAGEEPPGVDVVVGKPIGLPALRDAVARALAARDGRLTVVAAPASEPASSTPAETTAAQLA
jgi:CheY-like chemotaxis protein